MPEGDLILTAREPPSPMNSFGVEGRFKSIFGREGVGVAGSLLLHLLIVALLLLYGRKLASELPPIQRFVPVDLVAMSEGPAAQPAQQRAAGIRIAAPHISRYAPVVNHVPSGIAPSKTAPPPDDLELQLKRLSKLRQPNTDPRLAGNAGSADIAESGEDNFSGGGGAYTSRDIIRAQILRRWNLDLRKLGNRNFVILIHILLKRDGTVVTADIVDRQRYATDAVYRWIALSARNAILLASPLSLPPGSGDDGLDMTLRLNPRDAMQ